MTDKIEVTGIEIKINGEKVLLSIEEWGLRRELDDGLLHVEGVPYPYPWLIPYVPYVSYYEPFGTYGNSTSPIFGYTQ